MANRIKTVGVVAGVAAVAAGIAWYIHYDQVGRYQQSTNDATIQADQVAVASKLAGYVGEVAVADNQSVAQGSVLVRIDPVDYRTRLNAAQADLGSSLASVEVARAGEAEASAAVAVSQAALSSVQAGLAFAAREVARYRPLVASGAEPATRLSELEAQRDRAIADVASARAALDQAQRRVASAGAQSRALLVKSDAARVSRQAATNDLASTNIVASIAGRVANRSVRVGQYVQPGTRLLTLVPSKEIYVVANFKETQVGLMRPGQPATITVDALPGVEFKGHVISVTPGTGANFSLIPPQNATGNFTKIVQRVPVRLSIEAGPTARKVLVPGLSLEVEVDTRASADELERIHKEQE